MYTIDFTRPIHVHFIGIGGISMSGLAEVLIDRGFIVSGSDREPSDLTTSLINKGAHIDFPQKSENITDDIDLIVYTAAIHLDNPEMQSALASKKPMLTRAELLGQIMDNFKRSIAIAGTHGKTTTTGMVSQILLEGNDDPTISIGGILPVINSNVHVGDSDLFITEACEYSNSYHSFFPKYNIILNVEADHLDFFKTLENVRASFKQFAENTSKDGLLIINNDIPDVNYFTQDLSCRVLTYSLNESADCYPKDIIVHNGFGSFVPVISGKEYPRVELSVPGKHNISNAIAAIALCLNMGIDYSHILTGLKKFKGANRRFELKGVYKGATIIDDYAHHPTEIAASLSAARDYTDNRIIVVFQSHTYTRTLAHLDDFAKALSAADVVIVADIYPAREEDIYGVSAKDIVDRLKKFATCESYYIGSFQDIEKFLKKFIVNDDLLITMGAGNVNVIGENLLKE